MAVNLVDRAQKIMFSPNAEWDRVAAEPANTQEIAVGYVAPLVGAAQIAAMLGMMLFARVDVGTAAMQAVIGIILNFGIVFGLAAIVDGLAPNFGAQKDFARSFQVAAYSMTPLWIFSLLAIIPQLGIIALLLGLYSLYLIFVGLPKVKKPRKDQEAVYAIACIGAIIILSIVVVIVMGQLLRSMQGGVGFVG
jgi:hypothetical protein